MSEPLGPSSPPGPEPDIYRCDIPWHRDYVRPDASLCHEPPNDKLLDAYVRGDRRGQLLNEAVTWLIWAAGPNGVSDEQRPAFDDLVARIRAELSEAVRAVDEDDVTVTHYSRGKITMGDLRRAREALAGAPPQTPPEDT